MGVISRIRKGWNAFLNADLVRDQNGITPSFDFGGGMVRRPTRSSYDRSIFNSIVNRIALDVAEYEIVHAEKDKKNRFIGNRDSELNKCLTVSANLDQSAFAFRVDLAMTLCEKGYMAIVPENTTKNPLQTEGYDILSLRVGHIVDWYPQHVKLLVYNEISGKREELVLPKDVVAVVENPLYSVMNRPNSTLQRLIRKLSILDAVDEATGSGKLDMIIHLPYDVRTETKSGIATRRTREIQDQLNNSKYGIAYAGVNEKVTQLNRPAENQLLSQIEYLSSQLYDQLGITQEVFNGTASLEVMQTYRNRTVLPILRSITEEMTRKFLSKTARTQRQTITYFKNPFRDVAIANIADLGDKLVRNQILTPNEIRTGIGFAPSEDPKADELSNPNMPREAIEGEEAISENPEEKPFDQIFSKDEYE